MSLQLFLALYVSVFIIRDLGGWYRFFSNMRHCRNQRLWYLSDVHFFGPSLPHSRIFAYFVYFINIIGRLFAWSLLKQLTLL